MRKLLPILTLCAGVLVGWNPIWGQAPGMGEKGSSEQKEIGKNRPKELADDLRGTKELAFVVDAQGHQDTPERTTRLMNPAAAGIRCAPSVRRRSPRQSLPQKADQGLLLLTFLRNGATTPERGLAPVPVSRILQPRLESVLGKCYGLANLI
jgi:hypothetical protein